MKTYELDCKVKTLRKYETLLAELEADIDSLKDEIKAEMLEQDVDTIIGDDWKVTWKPVTTTRLDTSRFKAECPAVYKMYTKTSTSSRFILS